MTAKELADIINSIKLVSMENKYNELPLLLDTNQATANQIHYTCIRCGKKVYSATFCNLLVRYAVKCPSCGKVQILSTMVINSN